ncbi:hypothetical protein Pfo_020310 [Paulownia fortunei]|nr:hypothetical protein Pfo_020310 [Paulownia fortunei]
MVRVYKVKGQKRKKKEEKYDKGEEFEQLDEKVTPQPPKKKLEPVIDEMPGIPIVPVDTVLTSMLHANYLLRNKQNPADYRHDIAFQAIQTILDSSVNKSRRLKALYVRTQQGLLLEIKSHARMPSTYKRFSGLMGEVKNFAAVTQYLPINCRKIGFSHSSEKLVDMYDYVGIINNELDLVFVVWLCIGDHIPIGENFVNSVNLVGWISLNYCCQLSVPIIFYPWKFRT